MAASDGDGVDTGRQGGAVRSADGPVADLQTRLPPLHHFSAGHALQHFREAFGVAVERAAEAAGISSVAWRVVECNERHPVAIRPGTGYADLVAAVERCATEPRP